MVFHWVSSNSEDVHEEGTLETMIQERKHIPIGDKFPF